MERSPLRLLAPALAVAVVLLAIPATAAQAYIASPLAEGFEGASVQFTASAAGAFTTGWTVSTTTKHSGAKALSATDEAAVATKDLTSPAVSIPAAASSAQLSFFHSYSLENTFDGGVLELSVDGGPFSAAVPSFTSGAYNGTISSGFESPIAGRQAWTGNSGGFIETRVDLKAFAGHSVAFRLRLASDKSVAAGNWVVDDFEITAAVPGGTAEEAGTVGPADPVQTSRLGRNGVASTCGEPKTSPGPLGTGTRHFDQFGYRNGNQEPICVTVLQTQTSATCFSAAYAPFLDGADVNAHYLADPGTSAPVGPEFSFLVPPGERFAVVQAEVNSGIGCDYTLKVTFPPPTVRIDSAPATATTATPPTFAFSSSAANSTFVCAIDGGSSAPCKSPLQLSGLQLGPHGFVVTATDPNGVTSVSPASSTFTVVSSPPKSQPPKLSLSVSPRKFHAASSGGPLVSKGGAKVGVSLSEAATVAFTVQRSRPGRKAKGACAPVSKDNAQKKHCSLWRTLPQGFSKALPTGASSLRFSGRLGGRKLTPGKYRLLAVATGTTGKASAPASSGFTILP